MLPPQSACLSRRRVSANGGKKAEQTEQEKSESHWILSFASKEAEYQKELLKEYGLNKE